MGNCVHSARRGSAIAVGLLILFIFLIGLNIWVRWRLQQNNIRRAQDYNQRANTPMLLNPTPTPGLATPIPVDATSPLPFLNPEVLKKWEITDKRISQYVQVAPVEDLDAIPSLKKIVSRPREFTPVEYDPFNFNIIKVEDRVIGASTLAQESKTASATRGGEGKALPTETPEPGLRVEVTEKLPQLDLEPQWAVAGKIQIGNHRRFLLKRDGKPLAAEINSHLGDNYFLIEKANGSLAVERRIFNPTEIILGHPGHRPENLLVKVLRSEITMEQYQATRHPTSGSPTATFSHPIREERPLATRNPFLEGGARFLKSLGF